jgi:hypothetical protein
VPWKFSAQHGTASGPGTEAPLVGFQLSFTGDAVVVVVVVLGFGLVVVEVVLGFGLVVPAGGALVTSGGVTVTTGRVSTAIDGSVGSGRLAPDTTELVTGATDDELSDEQAARPPSATATTARREGMETFTPT